jgi:hypothetical protein
VNSPLPYPKRRAKACSLKRFKILNSIPRHFCIDTRFSILYATTWYGFKIKHGQFVSFKNTLHHLNSVYEHRLFICRCPGKQLRADCLMCARQLHRPLPGAHMRTESPGCRSAEQNSTCGFEAGREREKFYGIASAVRSFYPARTGIFAGASDEYDQFRISRRLITSSFSSEPGPKAPIYLRNQSLLC